MSDAATLECSACGETIDDDTTYDGECVGCFENSDAATYCCGQIYEEGESVCMSCGESL